MGMIPEGDFFQSKALLGAFEQEPVADRGFGFFGLWFKLDRLRSQL